MPYNVAIQSEQGRPLPGVIYFWLAGDRIGEALIPPGGITLTDEQVEIADHFTLESPGYYFIGTSYLYDENTFTLTTKPKTGVYIVLGLAGGFILSKLLKFKL